MIMHKISNIHVYIYAMTKYITSWSIGWMVKELVCGCRNEGSIIFNDILNLVLIDDNITTCVLNDYILLFEI